MLFLVILEASRVFRCSSQLVSPHVILPVDMKTQHTWKLTQQQKMSINTNNNSCRCVPSKSKHDVCVYNSKDGSIETCHVRYRCKPASASSSKAFSMCFHSSHGFIYPHLGHLVRYVAESSQNKYMHNFSKSRDPHPNANEICPLCFKYLGGEHDKRAHLVWKTHHRTMFSSIITMSDFV